MKSVSVTPGETALTRTTCGTRDRDDIDDAPNLRSIIEGATAREHSVPLFKLRFRTSLAEFANGVTFPIFAESETKFIAKLWPVQFEFSTDDHGQWTVLTRYQGNKDKKGFKK